MFLGMDCEDFAVCINQRRPDAACPNVNCEKQIG